MSRQLDQEPSRLGNAAACVAIVLLIVVGWMA